MRAIVNEHSDEDYYGQDVKVQESVVVDDESEQVSLG